MSRVHLATGPHAATLLIDNPSRGNALTPGMMGEATKLLHALADELRDEPRPHGGLVIRGAGERAFCAGYDLDALAAETATRPGLVIPELIALVEVLADFPVPTIAALNGHAIGGGALLASLCDLRYAVDGVRFRIPTTRIGIIYPLAGLRRLVALIGLGNATETLLLANDLMPARALAVGLYQAVSSSAEELDQHVREVTHALAERAPLASRGALQILRGVGQTERGALAELHAQWLGRCVASSDLSEGLAAARERRAPRFEGL